jgi:hydroxymethylbilane synthase
MKKTYIVASRGSRLAVIQSESIIKALSQLYPQIKFELKLVTTEGDKDRRTALWDLKTSGFFTSQVEDALISGKADLAVHSFKDLPTEMPEQLIIAAVCKREFPEDCLVAAKPISSVDELPPSAKIGTSSFRRAVQIKKLRSDLQPTPIRGNVPTRIRLLKEGKFDAVVLARAGLERLGMGSEISICFEPEKFIPAPAQGALVVQMRAGNGELNKLVLGIDDEVSRLEAMAERQILVTTQCGCHAPVGAFAKITGDSIRICAFISDAEGDNFIRREIEGLAIGAQGLGEKLANQMLEAGGREILKKLEGCEEK